MRRVRVGSLPSIPAAVVAATSFLAPAVLAPAHAGLEHMGPEGVDLTGVWLIDRERSDDPEQTLSSSERIEIMQLPGSVDLNLADRSVSCTSTAKSEVSLPNGGIADQTCGWHGGQFVIELRGRDGFRRTDRYSPGDGETLIVNTTVKGARMPELELKSVYVRHEPN